MPTDPGARQGPTRRAFLALTALAIALATVAMPHLAPIARLENRLADLRRVWLMPRAAMHPDIVVVLATETTFEALPYRVPLDRGLLADALLALADLGVRAVGLDVPLTRPTEPDKDAALQALLENYPVPLVAATRGGSGPAEAAFQDAYLRNVRHAPRGLPADAADGVVRRLAHGPTFAKAVARASGLGGSDVAGAIAWRRGPDDATPRFREAALHAIAGLPPDWFRGRIVLIGSAADPDDRVPTPFVAGDGQAGRLPVALVQAHAVAQAMAGEAMPEAGPVTNAAIALAAAALALLIGAAPFGWLARAAGAATLVLALWAGGFEVVALNGIMIALATPSAGIIAAFVAGAALRTKPATKGTAAAAAKPALPPVRRPVSVVAWRFVALDHAADSADPAQLATRWRALAAGAEKNWRHRDDILVEQTAGGGRLVFPASDDRSGHAARALVAALEIDRIAQEHSGRARAAGLDLGPWSIAVHTGPAVIAGDADDAFAAGTTLTVAERLTVANRRFGIRIAVSAATLAAARDVGAELPRLRPVGALSWPDLANAIEAFEPVTADAPAAELLDDYVDAYRLLEGHSPEAGPAFAALRARAPDDALIRWQHERILDGGRGSVLVLAAE